MVKWDVREGSVKRLFASYQNGDTINTASYAPYSIELTAVNSLGLDHDAILRECPSNTSIV